MSVDYLAKLAYAVHTLDLANFFAGFRRRLLAELLLLLLIGL